MEIKADKIHKTYGTITVLKDISFSLERGQKAGLIGYNGTGKTTLLRTISGELPVLEGKVSHGNALVIGNLTQEHDNLPRGESIKDFLTRRAGISVQAAYALAVKFGFKAAEIDKTIATLSRWEGATTFCSLFCAFGKRAHLGRADQPPRP
jgi:ATP-binding cassette subfamily F protein 3